MLASVVVNKLYLFICRIWKLLFVIKLSTFGNPQMIEIPKTLANKLQKIYFGQYVNTQENIFVHQWITFCTEYIVMVFSGDSSCYLHDVMNNIMKICDIYLFQRNVSKNNITYIIISQDFKRTVWIYCLRVNNAIS